MINLEGLQKEEKPRKVPFTEEPAAQDWVPQKKTVVNEYADTQASSQSTVQKTRPPINLQPSQAMLKKQPQQQRRDPSPYAEHNLTEEESQLGENAESDQKNAVTKGKTAEI